MKPDRVEIVVTADSYGFNVFSDGEIISNRASTMLSAGEAKGTKPGDIHDDIPDNFGDLAEAINDVDFGLFDIAGELFKIAEEY